MNFWIILFGSFGLLFLAYLLFMLVAFSGGALANQSISKRAMFTINTSLYLLPLSCFIAVAMLWYAYLHNFSSLLYWSFALPIPFIVFYFIFYGITSK